MRNLPHIGNLAVSTDVQPADWVVAGVCAFSTYTVCALVPQGFHTYARLFHPACRLSDGREEEVRWADVARANKRRPHPAMEWASITGEWRFLHSGSQPGLWDDAPSIGSLPLRQAARLAEMLAAFTSTPENCWFAVWEGWGELHPVPPEAKVVARRLGDEPPQFLGGAPTPGLVDAHVAAERLSASLPARLPRRWQETARQAADWTDGIPRVELPNRRMLLLSGPIFAVTTSMEPNVEYYASRVRANVWWPEDHSWCVATDIDLMTTYIGGSKECIETLMADAALEVMPVRPDQQVTWDSDKINPLPLGHPGS